MYVNIKKTGLSHIVGNGERSNKLDFKKLIVLKTKGCVGASSNKKNIHSYIKSHFIYSKPNNF